MCWFPSSLPVEVHCTVEFGQIRLSHRCRRCCRGWKEPPSTPEKTQDNCIVVVCNIRYRRLNCCELPGQMARLAEHLFRGRRLFLLTPPSSLPPTGILMGIQKGSRCIAFFLPLNHAEEWARIEKETCQEAIVQLFPLHPASPDGSHSSSSAVT